MLHLLLCSVFIFSYRIILFVVLFSKCVNDIESFTGSQFYVRKEILCVLENFMKLCKHEFKAGVIYQKHFVKLGIPENGKSSILALLFYCVAIE